MKKVGGTGRENNPKERDARLGTEGRGKKSVPCPGAAEKVCQWGRESVLRLEKTEVQMPLSSGMKGGEGLGEKSNVEQRDKENGWRRGPRQHHHQEEEKRVVRRGSKMALDEKKGLPLEPCRGEDIEEKGGWGARAARGKNLGTIV